MFLRFTRNSPLVRTYYVIVEEATICYSTMVLQSLLLRMAPWTNLPQDGGAAFIHAVNLAYISSSGVRFRLFRMYDKVRSLRAGDAPCWLKVNWKLQLRFCFRRAGRVGFLYAWVTSLRSILHSPSISTVACRIDILFQITVDDCFSNWWDKQIGQGDNVSYLTSSFLCEGNSH